jgi:hypothetical protein
MWLGLSDVGFDGKALALRDKGSDRGAKARA